MPEFFSLKTKIILLFLIPATVLIFFSYNFMQVKSQVLTQTHQVEFISKQIKRVTKLIRDIQLERGLSAGYIVAKNKKEFKAQLLKQFKKTDETIQNCLSKSKQNKKILNQLINNDFFKKIIPINKKLFLELPQRQEIRKKVLKSNISFQEEIEYYTQINKDSINMMKFLLVVLQKQNQDSISLINLEKIKEYAGLERACIYNQLLSQKYDTSCSQKISYFQKEQKSELDEFLLYASKSSLNIYQKNFDKKNFKRLQEMRKKYKTKKLQKEEAKEWFKISTQYIDSFNTTLRVILQNYINNVQNIYKNALHELYLAIFAWIISIFSTLYILILLNKIFKKEQQQLEELRIAAYTFDSQEAMAITDTKEKILKINKGFTRITGYTEEEAIGQTPRILQSGKHSKDFFESMWKTIHSSGNWKGDIYNKRKNGEIYPERLSITAIKDEHGNITNYIAQFLDITDLKKAQEEAEHQANHDILTKIANRKLLLEILEKELSKAKRHQLRHAFLFIDLDHFKSINDSYGHHIGDLLIKHTADILKKNIRNEDFVARISGDEFAILLLNLDIEDAESIVVKITNKILDELSKEMLLENNKIKISSSIGIRIFPLDINETSENIIRDADSAMYTAKAAGKNRLILHKEHKI